MKTIKIDCRKCKNCTGHECVVYGHDPDSAITNCVADSFQNYKPYLCVDCEHYVETLNKCKHRYYPYTAKKQIACLKRFKKKSNQHLTEKGGVE